VTAKWRHFDRATGEPCTASAERTFDLEAAQPLRYRGPRRGRSSGELEWSLRAREDADLRPVELRLRGVRRARLPGASEPLKTATFALRGGDRGLTYDGRSERNFRVAGWLFQAGLRERDWIEITMVDPPAGGSFGFELELEQAGRRIARTRAVGKCDKFAGFCPMKVR
jgi:hypothetical protein